MHQAPRAVEADHLAEAELEAVPIGLGEIVELVPGNVHAAGGDFMEQRLPQMGARLLDQRDVGAAVPAQRIAEPGDEFEPPGASAHDDDAMQAGARHSHNRPGVRRRDRHGGSPCRPARIIGPPVCVYSLRFCASQCCSRLAISAGLKWQ